MPQFLALDINQVLDGLFFGLGVLAVYLGAVITGSIIRSLGGAGGAGLLFLGKYFAGWLDYVRGDDRNTINVTLNMVIDGHLKFDTIVADRQVYDVWPNQYRVSLIRRAAKRTTPENPVIEFPEEPPPRGLVGHFTKVMSSVTIKENGVSQRVQRIRQDDYRATYGPLISLISERCTNDDSMDLAIGRPMEEHRFVIAVTFEKLDNRRARHLRAMVMWEPMLLNLPEATPRVDYEEHKVRYKTLLTIARLYRKHPERFGIVKVWRPKQVQFSGEIFSSIIPDAARAASR